MNVLITGGTGFIGSRLALRCLGRGDMVQILGQENTDAEIANRKLVQENGAEISLGSVTDREQIFELADGVDVIYHLAAAQHEVNVPDQHFWDVNVEGTRNILDAAVEHGVKRFVHGSTIGVYGPLEGVIDEQSPLKPDNIYGKTKLGGEKLVQSYSSKLSTVIVRISETYGPGDRRLLKLFKAVDKNVFFMIGKGKNLHHLIYIDDLIEGMLTAATEEKAVGDIFVLSGKQSLTTGEMVTVIAGVLHTSIRGFRAPLGPFLLLAYLVETVLRPFGIQPPLHRRRMDFFKKSFVFSQEKARDVLGFVPKYHFQAGAVTTVKWYKQEGLL